MVNNLTKQKDVDCAGHVMRNTSDNCDTLLRTRDGRGQCTLERGRQARTWVDDLRGLTGSKRYDQIKRAAEKRDLGLHGTFASHGSGRNNKNGFTQRSYTGELSSK